ncbi:FHA domain-containing protein [Nocardioides sp.]|uniref:FHA domain-containing protein n=1 Tax=Nocardioides sp. TaxID=35761 RepID=UPI002ED2DA5D
MDVRYAPGRGVLLSRAGRCLLVGVAPETVPGLVDRLWQVLEQPDPADTVLATVRRHAPGVAMAYVDAVTGRHLAELPGVVERVGDAWRLGAGEPGSRQVRLPLVEGVVAAAVVEVTDQAPEAYGPSPAGPLIDAIPPEILAAGPTAGGAPAVPTPVHPRDDVQTDRAVPDLDHDHRTRRRDAAGPAPTAHGSAGHLEQTTSDTVLAVRCPAGHLTDPLAPACRSCGGAVPTQEPQRVLRPPLGVLRLPDGAEVLLDRPVVLGRRPATSGPGDWPHLVQLPVESTYLSRNHLRIDLDGWHVVARDLGSRGGTTVFAPGRDPEKIRGQEPHVLEHGTVIDLAGVCRVTMLTATPTMPSTSPPHPEATT